MSARRDMQTTIGAMLDNAMPQSDMQRILAALDPEQVTAEQLAGAADAVMERAIAFPEFPDALDCCGTGGDGQHALNVSTASAIVTAACGVTIAKHGNRAVTSRCGSADVLEALGVPADITPQRSAQILGEVGLCFLFAPTFHPGFRAVKEARRSIARRTIFNLLGPLCNPARVKRQLIGTFSIASAERMIHAAHLLGRTHAITVHSADGSDEFSISNTSVAWQLADDRITAMHITPEDVGLPRHPPHALAGGDAAGNAAALRALLAGTPSAYCDAVLLNSAALLMLAQKTHTLNDGIAIARAAIVCGAAQEKLEAWMKAAQQ